MEDFIGAALTASCGYQLPLNRWTYSRLPTE